MWANAQPPVYSLFANSIPPIGQNFSSCRTAAIGLKSFLEARVARAVSGLAHMIPQAGVDSD